MFLIQKHLLSAVVFFTGACVLIIEVVAVRILSPYYGTTVYAVSSIIGVILAALSIGYALGGRLSDRRPSLSLFFSIIVGGGVSVLLLEIIVLLFLPSLGYLFSIISGPLVWSVVLFFMPALLLGMLSPFAISLQKMRTPQAGIGTVSGAVFFWSTVGSIVGSLLAGFVLIPHFGINTIMVSVGLALTVVGLLGLQLSKGRSSVVACAVLICMVEAYGIAALLPLQPFFFALYNRDGLYERIIILDTEYRGRPVRMMLNDQNQSGAMYLDSDDLVFDYTQALSLLGLTSDPRKILFMGSGPYSMPKAALKDFPEVEVHVVDIEPSLPSIGRQYFAVPNAPKLFDFVEDGRRFLHDSAGEYDLIFSDVYQSLYSIPTHFTTVEFFTLAHEKLSDGGLFLANIIGSLGEEESAFLRSEMKTFLSVFPEGHVFAITSPETEELQNFIFAGFRDGSVDLSDGQLVRSDHAFLRSLPEKRLSLHALDLSDVLVLTDNYAPVEHMVAKAMMRL
jgi:spermidine synthase